MPSLVFDNSVEEKYNIISGISGETVKGNARGMARGKVRNKARERQGKTTQGKELFTWTYMLMVGKWKADVSHYTYIK